MAQAFKVRRILHIGAVVIPIVGFPCGGFDSLPVLVALEDVRIAFAEHRRCHASAHSLGDFLVGWPDVFEIDRLAVLAGANRLDCEVLGNRSCKSVGNNQRW